MDRPERPYRPKKKGFASKPFKRYTNEDKPEDIRLNKYISNAGICSRRKADEYIKEGMVQVDGVVVTEMGYKLTGKEKVTFQGKRVVPGKKYYVLLNKPKGYITTTSDERGRDTVMDLVSSAAEERLYPVGRLDRNTTGVLLLTNDGNLAQKLMHPSFQVEKVYKVELNKKLTEADMEKIRKGVVLDDGLAEVDDIQYVEGDKKIIGIQIHIGKNRIVRRIFESMGYVVEKLDRVLYAGLTKKNLPRGKWRYLTKEELAFLQRIK